MSGAEGAGAVGGRKTSILVPFAFIAAFAIALVPLFGPGLPPLVDYPNHLARMFLIADHGRSAELAQYYQVHWEPLPNLAMDAIVPLLARVMPLQVAGKVFLAALLLLNAGGVVVLHRALWGRWRLWPCLGFLLLCNRIFLWGFVNFLFGQGLAFCAAAAWVALGATRPLGRAAVGSASALLVYFCHIEGCCILALIILGLEAGPAISLFRSRRWTELMVRVSTAGVAFLPSVALFAMTWAAQAIGRVRFSSPEEKLELLLTVFKNYHPAIDLISLVLFFSLFLSLVVKGRLRTSPALIWWLGLFVPLYVFLPSSLFSGASADHRLPVVISMLLVAGTAPCRLGRPVAVALTMGFTGLFILRMALIEEVWLAAGQVYATDEQILSLLPQGAKLGVASPWAILQDTDIPEIHIPTLAVPFRHAYVPTVFAFKAQQPVINTAEEHGLMPEAPPDRIFAAFVSGDRHARAAMATVVPKFDYLVFLHREPFQVSPDPCIRYIRGTATFQLFEVTRDGAGNCPEASGVTATQ